MVKASSAGTKPSKEVNPVVIQAMKEKGIDVSRNKPKLLDVKMAEMADVVVTMGCGAEGVCPAPLFEKVIDWQLEDPKGKPTEKVREIRDQIERNVLELISKLRE